MTGRARDTHRAAVYAAEDQWSALLDRGGVVDFFGSRIDVPAQRRFGDVAAVRRYVDGVLATDIVTARFPLAGPVIVRERAGQRSAHYEPATATIAIPMAATWAAREAVVLHEVAHHLACSEDPGVGPQPWHGARYRAVMCGLVAEGVGEPAALLLRAGYEGVGA